MRTRTRAKRPICGRVCEISETVPRSPGARLRRWARLSSRRVVQKPRALNASANCNVTPKAPRQQRHPSGGGTHDTKRARERPSLTAEGGLRGDKPPRGHLRVSRRAQHKRRNGHPSHLEQPLFVSVTPHVGSERWHHSSPTATSSAGVTRTNVGGAYVGDFSSSTTCKRLWAAPPLYVATRPGVLAALRAPGAPLRRLRRTWGPRRLRSPFLIRDRFAR